MIEYVSPEQLDERLVTLSLLPDSRWKNLLHLDIIKKRNKPKQPPKWPRPPLFHPHSGRSGATVCRLRG
uniref:WDR36/Utp21 C-terminal domain-containing protein n=1 Tax=Anguilla anguilla TaxID=7936 RepID=A0A0E9VL82_ANGAN